MAAPIDVSKGKVNVAGVGSAPVVPLLLGVVGAYLIWFAIHYWRDQSTEWASGPVKAVLQGRPLPAPQRATSSTSAAAQDMTQANQHPGGKSGNAYQGPVGGGTAQNTARLLLPKYGWTASQMTSLIPLWTRESGWRYNARNPTSGAYGIAQALGHGGSDTAAPDGTNEYGAEYGLSPADARAANAGNERWQIEWGLGYIKSRYGSPAAALAHENSFGWY
jgi:hypothetical protein